MAFPASPTNGQQVTVNNVIYQFDITKHAWVRLHNSTAANLIAANYVTVVNSLTSGNIFASQYYWANGTPFVSGSGSSYGNTEVAAYLLVDSTITGLQANAAFQANLIDVLTGNAATQGSLLDVLVANAAVQSANLAYLLSNAATQEASLTSLVSNAAAQGGAIDTINANIGAYQIYANANAATQQTAINTINANIGSYQTWANATFTTYSNTNVAGYLAGNITTGNVSAVGYYFANGTPFTSSSYGNTNVAAYLPTYTGNISAGNVTVTGNIVGGGVRYTASATAPSTPTVGDTWYETTTDILYRYITDGTNKYWVDVTTSTLSPNTGVSTGGVSPAISYTYNLIYGY